MLLLFWLYRYVVHSENHYNFGLGHIIVVGLPVLPMLGCYGFLSCLETHGQTNHVRRTLSKVAFGMTHTLLWERM